MARASSQAFFRLIFLRVVTRITPPIHTSLSGAARSGRASLILCPAGRLPRAQGGLKPAGLWPRGSPLCARSPPYVLPYVLLLVQMAGGGPLMRLFFYFGVLFIAQGAQSGAKRAIFSVAGLAAPPKASRRRHIECMQSESCSAWSSCEKGTAKGKGKDLLLQGREAEGEQRQKQTQQGN